MRLERINWTQAEEYFKHNDMVIIGTGSIECHGKHVALGTDFLVPSKIIELMEPRTDVLIAPTMPYGSCQYLTDFPGTVNLGYDVLYAVMTKITESLYKHGARKFLFMNGHGGNNAALEQVCLDLDSKGAKLEAIPGTPPNMIYPPKGDAFAARNKYAMQIDFEQQPPMFQVSDTHFASTWLLHPDAPKVDPPKTILDRIARMKAKRGD